MTMLLKPKDMPRVIVIVRVLPDGREICNLSTLPGRREYRSRTLQMLDRQGGVCCLEAYAPMCLGYLRPENATYEHQTPKSAGRRDDRIILPNGIWINGAAHLACNHWKGSRFIDYNRGFQP